jgi:hypothetical protein
MSQDAPSKILEAWPKLGLSDKMSQACFVELGLSLAYMKLSQVWTCLGQNLGQVSDLAQPGLNSDIGLHRPCLGMA